ncbi:MAG TPA: GatB/YqeY domain-containing protein [Longimicrobiales bacterium]|nr:GatB/YqeY domain-containing protein [Longimicrobiales bacterium]
MTGSLKERIRADMTTARKERDRFRTTLLASTLSEIRNREIEMGREAEDADVIAVLGRAIKQRRESSTQMRDGGRAELADKEDREAGVLGDYLPPQLGEDEVRALVREAVAGGADNIGTVMSAIMPRIKGSFDGREANRIAREELG